MMNDVKVNKARALYYGLFSRFFVFTTDNNRYLELISLIDTLKENPLDATTAEAFENIRKVLKSDSNIAFMNEFDDIFHSPETMTVRTTASYFSSTSEISFTISIPYSCFTSSLFAQGSNRLIVVLYDANW